MTKSETNPNDEIRMARSVWSAAALASLLLREANRSLLLPSPSMDSVTESGAEVTALQTLARTSSPDWFMNDVQFLNISPSTRP
jgi:hypothetical protein